MSRAFWMCGSLSGGSYEEVASINLMTFSFFARISPSAASFYAMAFITRGDSVSAADSA